jgi:PAS domain S-box-containing protein
MTQTGHLHLVGNDAMEAPLPEPTRPWTTGHNVQFYEDERFLFSSVSAFVTEGLEASQPILVIATEAHRRGIEAEIRRTGSRADADGHEVVWLDARETLAAFMEGGVPNRELFEATVGNVVDRLMDKRSYIVVRAYGEMVDLLWKDGNIEGAIALEDLWNGLAGKYRFNLLCAYSMGNFFKETHAHAFGQICNAHGRVAPTEQYLHGDENERLRQIAILQQRARALEGELHHRRDLEQALRETLTHRRRVEDELRRREFELRDTVENGLEAMHWVGPDGMIVWVNDAEARMLGYRRDEMIGKHVALFHADAAAIAEILARLKRGEEIHNFRTRLLCKGGSIRHVLINSNVFRQDGRFVHTRCFMRDITALVPAEVVPVS